MTIGEQLAGCYERAAALTTEEVRAAVALATGRLARKADLADALARMGLPAAGTKPEMGRAVARAITGRKFDAIAARRAAAGQDRPNQQGA
jgi:hypothetical protein